MKSEFSLARRIAETVRYLDDPPRTGPELEGSQGEVPDFLNAFGRNALRITSQVTPELHSIITTALRRLRCPLEAIEAFVYPSAELQASCISGSNTECVVTISSGLVELLEPDEMTFVVGHEIGHFLLRHGEDAHSAHGFLPERLIVGRRMEISADRMGLIACSSLDASIWAMMKTFSGLPKSHLNFDVAEFIAQIGETDTKLSGTSGMSTHPSMIVRSRALLWFSMQRDEILSVTKTNTNRNTSGTDIDQNIREDFIRYEDGNIESMVSDLKEDVRLWTVARLITADDQNRALNEKALSRIVGTQTAEKLVNFLASLSETEKSDVIQQRLESATSKLDILSPKSSDEIVANTRTDVSKDIWI